MIIPDVLLFIARTRAEHGGRKGWTGACDYMAKILILEQPVSKRPHLEKLYMGIVKRAETYARLFVEKKRKKNDSA